MRKSRSYNFIFGLNTLKQLSLLGELNVETPRIGASRNILS